MSNLVKKYRELGDKAKGMMFDESFQNYFYGAADDIECLALVIKVQGETIKAHEDEIDADKVTIARLEAKIERLRALLQVARCPNMQCTDGAIPHGPNPDGQWEAEQCQWCDERKQALAKDET